MFELHSACAYDSEDIRDTDRKTSNHMGIAGKVALGEADYGVDIEKSAYGSGRIAFEASACRSKCSRSREISRGSKRVKQVMLSEVVSS